MDSSDASREYFWGCELTKENPTSTWTFEEEEDDSDFLIHTLFLKQAILGASAVKEERNLVEVETKNFDNVTIRHPIASLTLGKSDMFNLDLSFGHESPVIFRLLDGSGPIHLVGQQLVEFPDEKNVSQEESEVEESEVESQPDEEDDEEEEVEKSAKSRKRKAAAAKSSKAKKGKLEEDEEEMEDEEDVYEEEDDMDDEDEDEEEEESSPEKVTKKKKTQKEKPKAAKKASAKSAKVTPTKEKLKNKPKKKGAKA